LLDLGVLCALAADPSSTVVVVAAIPAVAAGVTADLVVGTEIAFRGCTFLGTSEFGKSEPAAGTGLEGAAGVGVSDVGFWNFPAGFF
jgi:hypothetical protein